MFNQHPLIVQFSDGSFLKDSTFVSFTARKRYEKTNSLTEAQQFSQMEALLDRHLSDIGVDEPYQLRQGTVSIELLPLNTRIYTTPKPFTLYSSYDSLPFEVQHSINRGQFYLAYEPHRLEDFDEVLLSVEKMNYTTDSSLTPKTVKIVTSKKSKKFIVITS